MRHLRVQFDENIKGSDEITENSEEANNENQPASMRDYIRHVAANLKVLGEKVDKIQNRKDNLDNEILGKVRKDLGSNFNQ